MSKINTDQDPLQGAFHLQKSKGIMNNDVEINNTAYQAYAVSHEKLIKRFKLYLRSGERISIPYALLPITILLSNQKLLIRTLGLDVTISGRGLDLIDEAISTETLLYIKQNASDYDDAQSNVFIKDILCEGDLLMF